MSVHGLTEQLLAAQVLRETLGGARVELDAPMTRQTAAAVGEQIRAGLESGSGPAWKVEAISVTGPGPHLLKITVVPAADAEV